MAETHHVFRCWYTHDHAPDGPERPYHRPTYYPAWAAEGFAEEHPWSRSEHGWSRHVTVEHPDGTREVYVVKVEEKPVYEAEHHSTLTAPGPGGDA